MPPNITSVPVTGVLSEYDADVNTTAYTPKDRRNNVPGERPMVLVWRNIILMSVLHTSALYGLYLCFTSARIATTLYAIVLYQLGGFGITAGAHRLWAHRSYKATWQLRIILTVLNTLAFQDAAIHWARDHRVHHKYSETDADPHNARRGFFFSHVGWLLCRKHPEVKAKGKGVDVSDLEADPILSFQRRYYLILMPLICFIIPSWIPVYCWGESYWNAYFVASILRYAITLNATWLVNSAAHMWGNRPYDKYINPVENLSVAIAALGEGWHNYHHTFPWDYKTAEFGKYSVNFTKAFIDMFAKIGWAYDLKTVSEDVIKKRIDRTGDGSHEVWGWGDRDQSEEQKQQAIILNSRSY